MQLNLLVTLAVASLVLLLGSWVQRRVPFLRASNIPGPVIGGLLFAVSVFVMRQHLPVTVDTTLRAPLQILFFTTIGLGASVDLVRSGGRALATLWVIATAAAVIQNAAGVAVAYLLGVSRELGIIAGALTLTGGPATGLAFADVFKSRGIVEAPELIIAAATFGIVSASLVGNPVATFLMRRRRGSREAAAIKTAAVSEIRPVDGILHHVIVLLIVMGIGSLISTGISQAGFVLPAYIGAMVLGFALRPYLRLNMTTIEALGSVALAYFLAIALMDLKIAQLAALALPLVTILLIQVVVTTAYCILTTFYWGGRDYEAVATTSGAIGFLLGITPNAVANMDALVARYGPAPRSFLIVTITGGFLIDFSNSLVITVSLNLLR